MTEASASRRERLVFWAGVATVWLSLAVLAAITPIILDDWYQVAFIKHHGLSLSSMWQNAHYNYFNYNPRIGENILLLTNGPRVINTLLTPTVEVLLVWTAFAVTFGRWPKPSLRDGQLLLILLALIWLAAPIPGVLFTYRPFCTNYVYALLATLLWVLPFRLAVDPGLRPRAWMVPAMAVLGWVAGMGNEHTGPTAFLAVAALVAWHWRVHRKVHAWMWSGMLGMAIGYPMLFFAPGQKQRYGAIASRLGPMDYLTQRGPDGLFEIVINFLWEAQLAVIVILVALFVALFESHRQGRPAPSPDKREVVTMAALIAPAFLIVATLFCSPTTGERLFLAPATLFVMGGLVLVEVLMRDRRARRAIVGVAGFAVTAHLAFGFYVYQQAYREGKDREHRLETATPGQIAQVPPLSRITRNLWFLGEDFDYASLREFVSHEMYGLPGIEMDRPVRAEPSAPFTARFEFTMDPPMSADEVWKHLHNPLTYVSAYPDRDVKLVRQLVPQLRRIPGHKLIQVTTYVEGFAPPELHGRPFIGMRWKHDEAVYVDNLIFADHDLRLYFLLLKGTTPPHITDAYIHSCGKTVQVKFEYEKRGVRLPYVPWCRGAVITQVCNADECWLGGTYWH